METENGEVKKNDSWLITCPNCFAINDDFAIVCHKCHSKFGANLDPLGIARSEAEVLGKSTTVKPKFVVLIGTWILFLPTFLIGFGLIVNQIFFQYGSGTGGLLLFWIGIIIGGVSIKFLFTVTKNYFTMQKKQFDQDGEML